MAPTPALPIEQTELPWTDEELDGQQTRCDALLQGVSAAYVKQLPIKEGRCGEAIPLKLTAIGRDPAISIGGYAVMSCEMTAALSLWVREVLQPTAKALLGAPIARITTVSSYICRNQYGDRFRPLSEHALANALDIAVFETARGQKITVLDNWPMATLYVPLPVRKPTPEARIRALSAGAVARMYRRPGVPAAGSLYAPSQQAPGPGVARTGSADEAARQTEALPLPPEATEPAPPDPRSIFLRQIHADACKIFGTVLGPEANAAHRDHFHFDMAERRYSNFCQ